MTKYIIEKLNTIGKNISYYRREKNWTQEELAEKLEVSRTHIANIESTNINKTCSLSMFLQIAKILEIAPEELLKERI